MDSAAPQPNRPHRPAEGGGANTRHAATTTKGVASATQSRRRPNLGRNRSARAPTSGSLTASTMPHQHERLADGRDGQSEARRVKAGTST